MATLSSLPTELLINILSYLDVSDLYNIGDTCLALNQIINDEELWKNLFQKQFHTSHFSSSSQSSKFSVELFKRNNILHRWRKASGIHKTLIINAPSIEKIVFNYPKLLAFSDQGSINILSVEKGNTETTIPLTTPNGCTCCSFNVSSSVFGRFDGKVYGKLLATKSYLSSITEFSKQHEGMVTCIYNDESQCYSGDEKGKLFVWELKNGTFIKEIDVSTEPLLKVKALNSIIITVDYNSVYVIEGEKILSINHAHGFEFFEVDFGGKLIIVGNATSLYVYSFSSSTFGRSHVIHSEDEVHCVSIENKKIRNLELAGYDGCSFGIVTKTGRVMIHNIRELKVNNKNQVIPKVSIAPVFDDLKIPEGFPPINAVAVNATVILLGSYNAYGAVYNILTGEFLRIVTTRVPKRYLPLNTPPFLVPVKFIQLGYNNEANGLLLVGNVVQYFQFGELQNSYGSSLKKKKKNVIGVTNDRKDNMRKYIRHDLDELDHQDYQDYKREQLLNKYNGDELEDEEQIQLAMVLNASLHDSTKSTGKEEESVEDFIDEELARAIELSKFDHSVYDEDPGAGTSASLQQREEPSADDFEEQLKEAMRRSLYE